MVSQYSQRAAEILAKFSKNKVTVFDTTRDEKRLKSFSYKDVLKDFTNRQNQVLSQMKRELLKRKLK